MHLNYVACTQQTLAVSTHPVGPHYIPRSSLDSASIRRTQELQMCSSQRKCGTITTVFHLQTECNREYSVYMYLHVLVKFVATSERMDRVKRHYCQ